VTALFLFPSTLALHSHSIMMRLS